MAIKRFCDLCDSPAAGLPSELDASAIPSYGKAARIFISTNFSIRGADLGFGGPPDLCINCIDTMLEKYLHEAPRIRD